MSFITHKIIPKTIKKDSWFAWCMWFLGASFFFLEYVARVSPSIMAEQIIADFKINAFELGTLSAYFYYAYIIMQIPVGTLVDRFSVRRLASSMALLCALSLSVFALTHIYTLAELSRFFIGIGGAFAFVSALKLASLWFSPQRFGFLAGTTQALGMLGASVGEGPLSVVVNRYGWRPTLFIFSFIFIILAFLIFQIVRDKPAEKQSSTYQKASLRYSFAAVLKNPYVWLNGLFIGLLYAPTGAFGELWGPLYIQRVYGFSANEAASLVSLIFIGWAIGSPFFGWMSDKLQRRKTIMFSSAVLSLIFISLLLYATHLPHFLLFIIAFLYGMSNVGVSIGYAVACELVPRRWAGTSLGFTNMASIIVGAFFQPVVGWLLDMNWGGSMLHGMRFYTAQDFQMAMLTLPISLILCVIIGIFLKESYGGLPQQTASDRSNITFTSKK